MSSLSQQLKRSGLPVLLVLCLAALSVSYASADQAQRPLAVQVIGDPDAAVTGRLAVGTATPGSKALTVVGVIDFLGAGTVHNYFTQGTGNNMQINSNVDEANVVGDASRSQWKLVLGSSLDWFSIRRSPAGGTYNEDALFFIEGSTGRVGIATVDTGNGATITFTPQARLHVETASGDAIRGVTTASGYTYGVYGQSYSTNGRGVYGWAPALTGTTYGVVGVSASTSGRGVYGEATATAGQNYGVYGWSNSTSGYGVFGRAMATTGGVSGVYGQSPSNSGYGVYGEATATAGFTAGVYGESSSLSGYGVFGYATASTGTNYGVFGSTSSPSGYGVFYHGGLAGTGSKSAIVETQDYGWRTLYTIESPQNWFEDFGQATLAAGEAVVPIEPVFAQTVNLHLPYHVFLTPLGDCGLYSAEQTATSFTVRALNGAACDVAFSYRIVAPRLDYEDLRLEPAADPEAMAASVRAAE